MKPQQITETESRELILDSYVLHINTQHCDACHHIERSSQCFEVWLHPTKTRTSGLRDLRPAGRTINPKLAISTIIMPAKAIPVCVACIMAHPAIETAPPVSSVAWAETLKRKYAPAPAEPKVAKQSTAPAKAVPTLDQI